MTEGPAKLDLQSAPMEIALSERAQTFNERFADSLCGDMEAARLVLQVLWHVDRIADWQWIIQAYSTVLKDILEIATNLPDGLRIKACQLWAFPAYAPKAHNQRSKAYQPCSWLGEELKKIFTLFSAACRSNVCRVDSRVCRDPTSGSLALVAAFRDRWKLSQAWACFSEVAWTTLRWGKKIQLKACRAILCRKK